MLTYEELSSELEALMERLDSTDSDRYKEYLDKRIDQLKVKALVAIVGQLERLVGKELIP